MTSISDGVMWGRELPRRRPWDQSRLMDPAHPLLRGETLAVHLRPDQAKGVCLASSWWCPREKQSEELPHTNTARDSHVPTWRWVQWAVTGDCFVCWLCDDSQEVCTTGPISDTFTVIIEWKNCTCWGNTLICFVSRTGWRLCVKYQLS